MRRAALGPVSSDTLRTEDLLQAFADALEDLCGEGDADADAIVGEARVHLELDTDDKTDDGDWNAIGCEILEELDQALQEAAPPYAYFGAHEGDGACFGFWPSWESIEDDRRAGELPSGDELPDGPVHVNFDVQPGLCYLFLHVSDHGNAELYEWAPDYYENGEIGELGEWRSVWAVV